MFLQTLENRGSSCVYQHSIRLIGFMGTERRTDKISDCKANNCVFKKKKLPGKSVQWGCWKQSEGVSGRDPSSSRAHPADRKHSLEMLRTKDKK